MKTVTIELPAALAVNIKHAGAQMLDLGKMSPEWFLWAIANGVRQSTGDADAGMGDESIETRKAAVLAKFEKIAEGQVPSSGQGGARLSYVDKAWRVVLKAKMVKAGWKATDADKAVKNREEALKALVAKVLELRYKTKPDPELVLDAITRILPDLEKDVDREAAALEAEDIRRKSTLDSVEVNLDALGLNI